MCALTLGSRLDAMMMMKVVVVEEEKEDNDDDRDDNDDHDDRDDDHDKNIDGIVGWWLNGKWCDKGDNDDSCNHQWYT